MTLQPGNKEVSSETKKNEPSVPLPNAPGQVRFRQLISICAAFVATVGFVALSGWVFGLPVLASLGSGLIPVAPSTSVLFVLYAVAVFVRVNPPFNRWTYWTVVTINVMGTLLTALLFVLSLLGIGMGVEHLGFSVVNTPGEMPAGHMSPVTAFCFLLSSMSYLTSLASSRDHGRAANISWWLACCVIVAGSTLALAYLFGTPILYGSAFIPPAALTSMAFIALGAALLALAAPFAWTSRPDVESAKSATYIFLLVFILLAVGIVLAGFLYYSNYGIRYRAEVERQLVAVADLKVDELVHWREERFSDASLFYRNSNFSRRVQRYLQRPEDNENEQRLRTWLQHLGEGHQYDRVFLLDAFGRERMSVPETRQPSSRHVILRAAEALHTKEMTFEDFYRNEYDGRIYLAVFVPILDEQDKDRAMGTLVLRIDPEQYFYQFIIRWPTPSKTSETLLVRREGNVVLFLNELKFRKNTALNLRESLDKKELPAVQAVLGRQGIMEGIDYRGVPVLAELRAVPGSPWFLVSRMDISEVYGPMREKLWMTVVLVMAMLTSAGTAGGLVWRQQSIHFYRRIYESAGALQNSEERFRSTLDNMMEGCQIIGSDWRYIYLNNTADIHNRRPKEELLGNKYMDMWPGVEDTEVFRMMKNCMEVKVSHHMENEFIFPDGTKGWFDLSIQPVPEGIFILSIDITDRKKKESEIEDKNAELERFTYTVSHDLKSPLVTVKTFLGYLRTDLETGDNESIAKDMSYMHTAAEKMGQLLDELLEMSRVGRMLNPPVFVSFRELADEALNAVAGQIAEKKVEVRVGEEVVMLYGDRPRLAEIWQNLIENAAKFMGDQSLPRIELGVEQNGPAPIFFVRDNGMGIDPRYREKVFGLFDKLDPKTEGTGLGLALVKRIVELYRGKIWMESEGTGKGTCFRFTLPEAVDKQDKGEKI